MLHRFAATVASSLLFSCLPLSAQAPRIDKVDPPNWWINMPAPMLLVKGEHLTDARFIVGGLPIKRTMLSENGHWAELWLSKDATAAGEITLTAETQQGKAQMPSNLKLAARPATASLASLRVTSCISS
ncbi:cyclomaltodextrinase N-terminal domain-containing protein [Edaphobacter aggregans]|uniref:cyclomaltodextrinase N-terminal domain-containing protein n=1 Tax=Edaphobacter aggregans TaxID=570835 RepID=UPI00068B6A70|nr:cyclomaltodextrinase N-terminal domain-containing protein [Edaphobacter aggregans]